MFSSLDVECCQVEKLFSYDIPVITAIATNVAETHTSTAVIILGRNFREASPETLERRLQKLRRGVCWPIGQNRRHAVLHTLFKFMAFSSLGCTVESCPGASLDVLVQVDIISGSTAEIPHPKEM